SASEPCGNDANKSCLWRACRNNLGAELSNQANCLNERFYVPGNRNLTLCWHRMRCDSLTALELLQIWARRGGDMNVPSLAREVVANPSEQANRYIRRHHHQDARVSH